MRRIRRRTAHQIALLSLDFSPKPRDLGTLRANLLFELLSLVASSCDFWPLRFDLR